MGDVVTLPTSELEETAACDDPCIIDVEGKEAIQDITDERDVFTLMK